MFSDMQPPAKLGQEPGSNVLTRPDRSQLIDEAARKQKLSIELSTRRRTAAEPTMGVVSARSLRPEDFNAKTGLPKPYLDVEQGQVVERSVVSPGVHLIDPRDPGAIRPGGLTSGQISELKKKPGFLESLQRPTLANAGSSTPSTTMPDLSRTTTPSPGSGAASRGGIGTYRKRDGTSGVLPPGIAVAYDSQGRPAFGNAAAATSGAEVEAAHLPRPIAAPDNPTRHVQRAQGAVIGYPGVGESRAGVYGGEAERRRDIALLTKGQGSPGTRASIWEAYMQQQGGQQQAALAGQQAAATAGLQQQQNVAAANESFAQRRQEATQFNVTSQQTADALAKPKYVTGLDGSVNAVSGALARPVITAEGAPLRTVTADRNTHRREVLESLRESAMQLLPAGIGGKVDDNMIREARRQAAHLHGFRVIKADDGSGEYRVEIDDGVWVPL